MKKFDKELLEEIAADYLRQRNHIRESAARGVPAYVISNRHLFNRSKAADMVIELGLCRLSFWDVVRAMDTN